MRHDGCTHEELMKALSLVHKEIFTLVEQKIPVRLERALKKDPFIAHELPVRCWFVAFISTETQEEVELANNAYERLSQQGITFDNAVYLGDEDEDGNTPPKETNWMVDWSFSFNPPAQEETCRAKELLEKLKREGSIIRVKRTKKPETGECYEATTTLHITLADSTVFDIPYYRQHPARFKLKEPNFLTVEIFRNRADKEELQKYEPITFVAPNIKHIL